MNNLFVTAVSSLFTLSSMTLAISPQANALTYNYQQDNPFLRETTSPTYPQPTLLDSSDNLIAGVYCQRRGNQTCCADSYGNWSCYWG